MSGAVVVFVGVVLALPTIAQPADPIREVGSSEILLSFPENAPLKSLIAYVGARLNLNLLYDEGQIDQRFTLQTPAPIAEGALLELLDSVLRSKGLSLQETDVPGMKRIVPAQELLATSRVALEPTPGASGAVTRAFRIEYAQTERIIPVILPLLTKPGGQATPLAEERLLIVTDFASNINRLSRLIEAIDQPKPEAEVRTVEVPHGDPQAIAKLVTETLRAADIVTGRPPPSSPQFFAQAQPGSRVLVVAGLPSQVERAVGLIESLATIGEVQRRVYRPETLSADKLDTLIRESLGTGDDSAGYRSAVDSQNDLLIVTASPAVHEEIDLLREEIEAALPGETANPVRFYRLKNAVAASVLNTLRSLEGGGGIVAASVEAGMDPESSGPLIPEYGQTSPRAERSGAPPLASVPSTEAVAPEIGEGVAGPAEAGLASMIQEANAAGSRPLIAADESTNSIIVVGSPAQQRMYGEIIAQLDRRRPQVLIETTIVTLDTSDDFTLGVEVGGSEGLGNDGRVISFSSFGIADVDPTVGSLAPILGRGGTFALLAPEVADVVVRALANSSRSQLVSIPRILVNDNEEGTLDSLSLEPFAVSVVTDTSTTTTAGGPAEAGTEISVTPHISDDDYLQLEYYVELSSFTSEARPNLPPPSQQNTVSSMVTIPDGYTIVVGGLNRREQSEQVQKIPLLGDIPLAGSLFRRTDKRARNLTLFVFIRPIILSAEDFRDLRYLSDLDRNVAGVPGDFPESEPLLIEPAP